MMKRFIVISLLFVLNPIIGIANTQSASLADLVERTSPAVVNISTTQNVEPKAPRLSEFPDNPLDLFEFFEHEFNNRRPRKTKSLGSGFIIDPQGFIVTSYHVIAGADQIEVMVGNDNPETYKAKVVGKDQKTDLALLKITATKPLPFVRFGDSEKSRVGDSVFVIGNPFGLGGTVTTGIVSAKGRYLNSGQFDDYIQTDASINKGNSGGPMFNMDGEVIGVNRIILSTSGGNMGIGFAIPSSLVIHVTEQLKTKGEIVRGWLGVKVQYIDENISKALNFKGTKGALVADVIKGSPADKAGIKAGDIITRFDGKDVPSMHKLPKMVAEVPINKSVTLQIFRDGKFEMVQTVIEKPIHDASEDEDEDSDDKQDSNKSSRTGKVVLGLKLIDLDKSSRSRYKIEPEIQGVLIVDISRDSQALDAGISAGDIIQKVNQKKVNKVSDFENAIKDLKDNKAENAVLLVYRNGENRFVVVSLD